MTRLMMTRLMIPHEVDSTRHRLWNTVAGFPLVEKLNLQNPDMDGLQVVRQHT